MSIVTKKDGSTKLVKNLGWLLRYASKNTVKSIKFQFNQYPFNTYDGTLTVLFDDGTRYETEWQNVTVFKYWINRPTFKGCTIYYYTPNACLQSTKEI